MRKNDSHVLRQRITNACKTSTKELDALIDAANAAIRAYYGQ